MEVHLHNDGTGLANGEGERLNNKIYMFEIHVLLYNAHSTKLFVGNSSKFLHIIRTSIYIVCNKTMSFKYT